ncbi:HCP-like protein [Rhizophagus irregularis]|uniref:HCP-like protein n=1 Tax=Rhizophagus irregularis TaxID=588596 RepID=A0A2N0RT97_9GLOM|nr:HCP-like protein [Rhizophagus irregularis]
MSITEKQNSNLNYIRWIKKAIENNFIIYYDHTEFKNKKEVDNSNNSVGKIFETNWNNTNLVVKTSYELDIRKIVNELKLQKEVDFHLNILRIYGVSKLDNQYSLVLEYADGGSLYFYLKGNFTKLEWDDKYCLASQLASAIDFIHSKGIIHCNLHEENVLIHKNNIKVADFSLSKRANKASNYSNKVPDFLPYLDPKILNNVYTMKCESQLCKMNFKSDIYSIGVLFWLLSSGRRPFYDKGTQCDISLAMDIVNGKREEIIKGTPVEYSDIYTACWSDDPDERPSIQIVVSCLRSIIDHSIKSITNEIKNEALDNDFEYMFDDYDLSIHDNIPNIVIDDFSLNTSDLMKKNLLLNLSDLTNNVEKIVDKLIDHLIRLHDELGYDPTEIKEIISQNIQDINKSLQIKISDWLIRNQTSSKYIFFHGFLYYNGIIVKKDEDKAFGLFSKASKSNYPIAQFYLGKLYKDPKKAFYWYQKSAENGNKHAQFYLGKCYEEGKGIEKDGFKAFECYEKAVKNGNKFAQLSLGYYYDNGIGTQVDEEKAIEWYEKSAIQEYDSAQLCLGFLYKRKKKESKKSFHWFEKAAKNGSKVAQFYLGKYYYYGTGIEKDYGKSFEWYEKSAKQGDNNALYALANLYMKGRGTEKNLEEASYLIEKAAKKGNKFAQLHLGTIYQNDKGTKKNIKRTIEWYKKSAEQGYSIAQYNLGYLYERGEGIDQNIELSLYWYEKAAKNGNKFAQLNLGYFYENGMGTQKDIKKAIIWYEKSAKQEYGNAQCSLGYLYEKGKGIDQDLEKAIYWYKKATENGYEAAYYYLGKCYHYGNGIEKNEVKAFEHYKKSVEKGYLNGIYMLGYCYENGIGTNIDKEKAVKLYNDAAKRGNRDAQKRLELI